MNSIVIRKELQKLAKKVQQQEETITQLVEIIAVTNRKMNELRDIQSKYHKHAYFLSS